MAQDNGKIVVSVDSDLEELIPGFLENRKTDVTDIRDALGKGDFDTVKILGHSMKGSGGGYGFDRISEIGAGIEQASKDSNVETINKFTDELVVYLDSVEVVYVNE